MNRKKFLRFFSGFTLILIFPIQILFAQTLPLKHYTDKDGLASSFVNCISQDHLGFLWFGTEHGLSRFNGIKFQHFTAEKNGLKNDYINALLEDKEGNLWIGTDGGLTRLNASGFKTYTTADGLPSNRIYSIQIDRDGNLWIGTRAGISRFDGTLFTTYSKKDGLIDNFIKEILIDEEGNLWIGTEQGLSYLAKKNSSGNGRFINYTINNGLAGNEIQALLKDYKGNIWIGTSGGLNCFQKEKKTFISYTTKDGMANNNVNAIMEAKNKKIWIGTEGGISCRCSASGEFTNYYSKNGFPSDKVYAIFQDREGNIWFGTNLWVSRLQSLKITNFSKKDGLPDNLVWAIIEEKEGKYWIGTDKGLSCYSQGAFKTLNTEDGLISNSIFNLMKDRAGNLWIATSMGLSIYGLKSGKFDNYTTDDGLPGKIVLSLAEDGSGVTWIGTDKGICRFVDGKILPPNFDFKRSPLAVHAILEDRKGNFWFSDSIGLWKISNQGKKSTAYHYSVPDGLIHNKIYSLLEDRQGKIWIGTHQGLSCFYRGKFTNYTTSDGLSHNACLFVLEDDEEMLWIGTTKGVNRFNGKSFKTYTARDGFSTNEMSQCTPLKDSYGNLWFGTINGITRFNPRLDRLNTVPPPIYITGLSVWENKRPLSDNLKFRYNENYIKFDFIGLCFTSPEDVVYRYRLKGVDRSWNKTGNRDIFYHSLAPGKYLFKVTAKNNDGFESVKPAEIGFEILPPFWLTWWFRGIAAFLFLVIIAMMVLFKIKRLKEKIANEAKNKQLIMAQRMKLLGILAGGAAHDLKNLLGIIIGYSSVAADCIEEEEEVKGEALGIIKNTADTAFHVVKQMLAFTRQSYDKSTASNLSHLLNELLEILKVIVPKDITIRWEPPADEILLHINPVKFKQVAMNLCLNAIQAMQEQGELKILLIKDPVNPDQIIFEVSDTGPGIEQEIQDKIFEPLFTTKETEKEKGAGLGLFVVKQIIDEFGGKISIQSKPGEGTTFKILFPIKKDSLKNPIPN